MYFSLLWKPPQMRLYHWLSAALFQQTTTSSQSVNMISTVVWLTIFLSLNQACARVMFSYQFKDYQCNVLKLRSVQGLSRQWFGWFDHCSVNIFQCSPKTQSQCSILSRFIFNFSMQCISKINGSTSLSISIEY